MKKTLKVNPTKFVYLVQLADHRYEDDEAKPIAVFSKREKAEKFINECKNIAAQNAEHDIDIVVGSQQFSSFDTDILEILDVEKGIPLFD